MYLRANRQRGGIGRRLMQALMASDAGVRRAVGYKFGRWLDTVEMQKALGPGDRAPPEER